MPPVEPVPQQRRPPAIARQAPADAEIEERRVRVQPLQRQPEPEAEPDPTPEPEVDSEIAAAPAETPVEIPPQNGAPEPEPDRESVPAVAEEPASEPVPEPASDPAPEAAVVAAPPRGPALVVPDPRAEQARLRQVEQSQVRHFVDLLADSVREGGGTWERRRRSADMTDPEAMYAKLIMATPMASGPTAYEFTARSMGRGFVGFGMHVHGRGEWNLSYYGGGDSILVWITSDPDTYGEARPRLQVYRSVDEVGMTMVAATRIPGSAFDERDYRIEYYPAAGSIVIYVDNEHTLSVDGFPAPGDFDYAALRALDEAAFSQVRIAPLPADQRFGEEE